MRVISTAWISGSLEEFEATCCLNTHGALGLATKETPLEVFILRGFEKLTAAFTGPLAERSIYFYDLGALANSYLARYNRLFDLLSPGQGEIYEVLCFLRWIVLEEYLAGDSFLHIDLDLFFQKPLAAIAHEFEGHTGTFGSPCLTAVSSTGWLSTYHHYLDAMVADRSALQSLIGYTGNEFRGNISSDQDLINALELSGNLQHNGLASFHQNYQVFINPIWPYQDKPAAPFAYAQRDGIDVINEKPVLFWHLQNNFADYVSRYATVKNYEQTWLKAFLPVKLNLPFIQLAPSAENFAFQALRELAWQRIHEAIRESKDIHALGMEKFFSRTWVSTWFILQKEGRGLFSSQYWWEDSVFM